MRLWLITFLFASKVQICKRLTTGVWNIFIVRLIKKRSVAASSIKSIKKYQLFDVFGNVCIGKFVLVDTISCCHRVRKCNEPFHALYKFSWNIFLKEEKSVSGILSSFRRNASVTKRIFLTKQSTSYTCWNILLDEINSWLLLFVEIFRIFWERIWIISTQADCSYAEIAAALTSIVCDNYYNCSPKNNDDMHCTSVILMIFTRECT